MAEKETYADFRSFADNTNMGSSFELDGFKFDAHGIDMIVNESGGGRGLQYPSGLKIWPPMPVEKVRMRVGTFNGPTTIVATSKKQIEDEIEVPMTNSYHDIQLNGKQLVELKCYDGGAEPIIEFVCV